MKKSNQIINFSKIEKLFQNKSTIASVFIFGSSIDGIVNIGSDLDIAVLYNETPTIEEKLNLHSHLCDFFDYIENIDMVILNDVNEILAFEALSGRRISNNNPHKTAEFTSYVSRVYEDNISNIEYQYSLRSGN